MLNSTALWPVLPASFPGVFRFTDRCEPATNPRSRASFMKTLLRWSFCLAALILAGCASAYKNKKPKPITHSFLATGAETRMISKDGQVTWRYPIPTRDGWVLKKGNVLLAVTKCDQFPNGGVVEVSPRETERFQWKGTQSEVNTVQPLPGDRLLVTEAGPRPRVL